MKVYGIGLMDIKDRAWVNEYVAAVTPMIERRGGRFLARTSHTQKVEGDGPAPHIVVVVEFPSQEVASEFYSSDEYRPFLESRKAGTRSDFFMVPGEDITGASVPG